MYPPSRTSHLFDTDAPIYITEHSVSIDQIMSVRMSFEYENNTYERIIDMPDILKIVVHLLAHEKRIYLHDTFALRDYLTKCSDDEMEWQITKDGEIRLKMKT